MKKVGYTIRKKKSKDGTDCDYFNIEVEDNENDEHIKKMINAKHSKDMIYESESIKILSITFIGKELIERRNK